MSSGSFGPPFAPAYTCWCCARARLGSTLPPGKGLQRKARHGTPWASTSARTRHGAYSLPGWYQRRVAPCPSSHPGVSSVRAFHPGVSSVRCPSWSSACIPLARPRWEIQLHTSPSPRCEAGGARPSASLPPSPGRPPGPQPTTTPIQRPPTRHDDSTTHTTAFEAGIAGPKPSVSLRTHVGEVKLLGQPNLRSGVDSDTRGDATPYDDRPVSLYNTLADAAASAAHKARFAQPVDAVGTAAAVVRARAVSAAHVPSDAITIVRPQGQHRVWKRAADATTGLHFHSRARRDGDFEWHAAADDSTCVSAGKVNNPKYDLRFAADRDRIGCETNAEAYDYMHAGWQCATWSGALSVPPGGAPAGTPPVGPYRGPHARADLSAAVHPRCGRGRRLHEVRSASRPHPARPRQRVPQLPNTVHESARLCGIRRVSGAGVWWLAPRSDERPHSGKGITWGTCHAVHSSFLRHPFPYPLGGGSQATSGGTCKW